MQGGRVFIANGAGFGRLRATGGTTLYGHFEGSEQTVPISGLDIDAAATRQRFGEANGWNRPEEDQRAVFRRELVSAKNREIHAAQLALGQIEPDAVTAAIRYTKAADLEARIAVGYLEQQDYRNAEISLLSAASCAEMARKSCSHLQNPAKPAAPETSG
jgi:hypothetical protein